MLALLVVFGSMVAPIFTNGFSSVRLRRAGDQVLSRWSAARARAIETGEVRQFTFTPESGDFRVGPWTGVADKAEARQSRSSQKDETSSTDEPSTTTAAAKPADPAATETEKEAGGTRAALPEPILFQSGQIAVDDPESAERRVDPLQPSGEEESTPILFFPDGTTSEASVVLANDRNQFVRLTLRGLTGVGRASGVLTRDELERATRGR